MIIARTLRYMKPDEASQLNWKKMTHDFNESTIDSFIDMQNNRQDKISVCDMILYALKNDRQKYLYEEEIENRLILMRKMIENGVFSPYREIERLTKENNVKDKKIIEFMVQLEAAKNNGDELKEVDVITKIVEQAVKINIDMAINVEFILGRIYRGTSKFAKHFKLLEDYISNRATSKDILSAIADLNKTFKKGVEDGVTVINTVNYNKEVQEQNLYYPSLPSGQQQKKLLENE